MRMDRAGLGLFSFYFSFFLIVVVLLFMLASSVYIPRIYVGLFMVFGRDARPFGVKSKWMVQVFDDG